MRATAVRIKDAMVAFRLLSDIRRLADSSLWGDVSVVARGRRALLLIPSALWRSPAVRDVVNSYRGQAIATDVDPETVALDSTGVTLDLHPNDARLRRSLTVFLARSATSWSWIRSGGTAGRGRELLGRAERRMRSRYPRIRIVTEKGAGDGIVWHVYKDGQTA